MFDACPATAFAAGLVRSHAVCTAVVTVLVTIPMLTVLRAGVVIVVHPSRRTGARIGRRIRRLFACPATAFAAGLVRTYVARRPGFATVLVTVLTVHRAGEVSVVNPIRRI